MKKLKILIYISILILGFSACENLEEINKNNNAPSEVTPDLLLPNIIRESVNQMVNENWSIGNIMMQHMAKIQFVNDDRYNWGNRTGIWDTYYGTLRNVNNSLIISEENGLNNYKAVSLIMKSWMFAVITDLYGNVPYSEALQGKSELFFPAYDTQESIYAGILADLKTASELIGTTNETVSGDILFGGNLTKWKKLANSLRLRYLLRISDRKSVSAEMKAIVDNPATYPIFTGNTDNAQLAYTKASPNQFPLHTSRVGSFDEFRLSKHLGDTLLLLKDPRITVFARPTAATENLVDSLKVYAGVPNGLDDVTALTYNGGAQNISRVGSIYYENAITDAGIAVAKGTIMTYSELCFILAEASKKGLITNNTKTYYENGVASAFGLFGLTIPADYLSSTHVAFDDNKALEQIGLQKWIAFFFNGLEGWFDWRRTGIPVIKPGPSNLNENKVPVRYVYPLIEQSLNAENRVKALEVQGEDDINTRVWWDIN